MNNQKSFKSTVVKLKTRGYWRVEFYPNEFDENVIDTLAQCKEIMRESSVHFRGWDVPHIPVNPDDKQDIYPIDNNRYESWIDWSTFKEVWRMYQSGKLTFLDGLNEHWYDEYDGWASNPLPDLEPASVVDVINVIYTLTEFMYFFHSLAAKMPNISNWSIKITLNNVENNQLATLDRSRISMLDQYTNRTASITAVETQLSDSDLKNTKTCLKIARDAAQRVFQSFEWQAADVLIDGEQEKLINRRF